MKKLAAAALGAALAAGLPAVPARPRTSPSTSSSRSGCRPQHPLVPASKAWADDIKKQSGGSIKITIFPSEQLGKAFDHYDMARDGIADITYVNPGYQPGRFPIIAPARSRSCSPTPRRARAALDAWYRKYAAKEMKDTHFCFAFMHDPGTPITATRRSWCRRISRA